MRDAKPKNQPRIMVPKPAPPATPEPAPEPTPPPRQPIAEAAAAEMTKGQSAIGLTADHLDGFEVGHDPGAEPEPEAEPSGEMHGHAILTDDGFLTCEVWTSGLGRYLRLSGNFTGLQTLLLSPDMPEFPEAAAATYDSIRDLPALHFLIKPGGVWAERAAAILAFSFPLALGVKMELGERRAAIVKAKRDGANMPEPEAEPEPGPAADRPEAMPGFD